MNDLILLIGGNQGNRISYLERAICDIEERIGPIQAKSHVYKTAPWGNANQPSFYNQAIGVKTQLSAKEAMATILVIEEDMGRIRIEKNGPRTIDIDILYYNKQIVQEDTLEIPHPRIAERKFVLMPLVEIYPNWIDPVYNKTIQELIQECKDTLTVDKLSPDCA